MNALRDTCIGRARKDVQDCLVIGGGINGAVSAAALAGRGAKVTVIDKGDFAACTSQESSNLAWGGIKYLETYEFPLVWKLCQSRNHLMDAYPSRVEEVRFYTSIAEGFRKPRFLIYIGALLYWLMGRCRTRPPRLLSREKIKAEAPMVQTEQLAGGIEYSDCYFFDNDARFTFDFIRKVLKAGGNAVNYMELISADWQNAIWHCVLKDRLTGDELNLRAKTLVNAAGPYADAVNEMLHIDCPFKHVFSKGVHIIVPRVTNTKHVLTFFASDGRLFFMIPMSNRTCIGTTDTHVETPYAEPTDEDVNFLLENANTLLTLDKPLTREDVIATRCGVRPLVVRKNANIDVAEWTALSRKHEIDRHPERGMCSIYGGKLTDCINVGIEVSDMIESYGVALFQSLKPWYGEAGPHKMQSLLADAERAGVAEKQARLLWRRYGTDALKILRMIRENAAMGERVIGKCLRAELHWMAENEMVIHLEDFLRRRSPMALIENPSTLRSDPGLAEAAKILFGDRAQKEIDKYFN